MTALMTCGQPAYLIGQHIYLLETKTLGCTDQVFSLGTWESIYAFEACLDLLEYVEHSAIS